MRRRAFVQALGCAVSSGCVPMTFSREPAVDFSLYRKVGIDVRLGALSTYFGEERASSYLASELRRDSGFEEVTVDLAEPDIDLFLNVSVSLIERIVEDEYGFLDVEYEAVAQYAAVNPDGQLVDSGTRADVSRFPDAAIEYVLDEVALRYFKPYRL